MTIISSGNEIYYAVNVKPLSDYRLELSFNDGLNGVYDVKPLIEKSPIFKPLEDQTLFSEVQLDSFGAPYWPGDIDIAPDALYKDISNHSKES